jgi:hypothetical protein
MKTYRRLIFISPFLIMAITLIGHSTASASQVQKAEAVNELSTPEERWGIKVIGIRTTAAGHMLNFRYKIVNPEKVSAFMGPRTKPYLIDQESGKHFKVPEMGKVGALYSRMNRVIPGRTYFALFENSRMLARPGSKVTVVMGDFRVKDLVVQ